MSFFPAHKYVENLDFSTTHLLSYIILAILSWYIFVNLSWSLWNRRKWPPGPKGLPLVGYLPFLGDKSHEIFLDMKKKYGNIIGLYVGRKFTVVINDYNVMKEVYNHPGSWDRSPDMFQHVPLGFGAANGKEWIEQRRFCLSAIRDLGIGKGDWEALVAENLSKLIKEVEKYDGKPVNIYHSLGLSLSTNIISLLIGRRLTEEESDKAEMFLQFAEVFSTKMGPASLLVAIPGLRKLFEMLKISGSDKSAKVIRQFISFMRGEINRHKSGHGTTEDDFINMYLKKQATDQQYRKISFSDFMLEGNLSVLFLGTNDTVKNSMIYLMKYMAECRDVQENVYKELMEVLGKDGMARYEERNKIPYTFAVLMESQRCGNMVPLSTTRRANQDIPINGYIIPKGADIFVNLYALHNDPKYWKHPEKFTPEHFLDSDGKLIHNPPSFAPFSTGRRNCPGEHIAWMEILPYFSEIVKHFDISIPPGETLPDEVVPGLVQRLLPFKLCFKKRN